MQEEIPLRFPYQNLRLYKKEYQGHSQDNLCLKYIGTHAEIPEEIREKADAYAKEGKTPLFFAEDKKLLGIIAVADVIREESPKAIARLKKMGIIS